MAVRPIIRFRDPLLSQPCRVVVNFDEALAALAADLSDTMRAAPGIGIAGPHIGVLSRVAAIDLVDGLGLRVYVNPRIIAQSKEQATHSEGSISMPGVTEEVMRPESVTVAYQTLSGSEAEIEASGLLGVCLQHEIDQLDGIFWINRLSRLKRDRLIKQFSKRQGN
ncbi:peptide deformylase [Xaviernesmea oryzae]|uniref:Peptide deformylase-like n=1 Tax=Xaviernesmea oryzae TaxID=464029 RepID=A0A1Q9AYL3_9HYPH|nr:peptide deformylase [Xaviernesmea oryzae]OLP60542.1 peptide deformylase [Xaviernesmea oryzae]SEM29014.1 peptide deformylase [Xaviernesmea oryzae]